MANSGPISGVLLETVRLIKSPVIIRDSRTAWFAHRSVQVGAILIGFYWRSYGASFWVFCGSEISKFSGAWIPAFVGTIQSLNFKLQLKNNVQQVFNSL